MKQKKEVSKYERELPINQRWISGQRGKYAISESGTPYRYNQEGCVGPLKTVKRGKQIYWRVFHECESLDIRVADILAKAFLGTKAYIFIDGNPSNVQLSNLQPVMESVKDGESWIEGYEGLYTINNESVVHSYKDNIRRRLSDGGHGKVCLMLNGHKKTFLVRGLFEKYVRNTISNVEMKNNVVL